jgi:hypothetical protein
MKLERWVEGEEDGVDVTAVERGYAGRNCSPQQRLADA